MLTVRAQLARCLDSLKENGLHPYSMEERKDSTARHIRSFGDLHLAAANVYAYIDVYDLFRRVVNMIASLEYSYMYLVVLRSVITEAPQKKLLCSKWHKLEKSVIQVPFRTTVDVLTDVTYVPLLSRNNCEILKILILRMNVGGSGKRMQDEKEAENDEKETPMPVLLLSPSVDESHFMPPVEPAEEFTGKSIFKSKRRPFQIRWNHEGEYDIGRLHKKYGSNLTDDDLDILTDQFLWPCLKLTPAMSLLDKLSVILTGYLYSGELESHTLQRFWEGRSQAALTNNENLRNSTIPAVVFEDLDFKTAEASLTELKLRMTAKMKEFEDL